jgi:hypothetical protein
MAGAVVGGYFVPPRLAGPGQQLMQGDVFVPIPCPRPAPDGTSIFESSPVILLTPTCDFALKESEPERHIAPIEPLAPDDPRLTRWQVVVSRHLLLLPPLPDLLPHGGLIHFRRSTSVHADSLERATRVATLNEAALRSLLAAHTTYYTRATINPNTVPIAQDDPRLLWQAIDAAEAVASLAERRHALQQALAVAVQALARHHGIVAPSPEAALAWLPLLAERDVLPLSSAAAVACLVDVERTLRALYQVLPANLESHRTQLDQVVDQLERLGAVLQERHPLQLTPALLREAGLANLIR